MKRISTYLTLAAFVFMASCEKPEPDPEPVPVGGKGPVLVSSDPADGTADILGSSLDLVLTYDRNILCLTSMQGNITVDNGARVDAVEAAMAELTVSVSGLQSGKTYTVTIPEGTVTGYDNSPAGEVSISFSTKEEVSFEDQEISESLVTPDPIPAAKKLYDYLRSIYGKQTLSGAMAHVAWNTGEAEWVGKFTGKYPAVAYFDYIHLAASPANWIDYGDITPALDWWNAGGLIGASWHWNVPRNSSETDSNNFTCDAEDNEFNVTEALKEGTWQNEFMHESLEKITGYLKLLQDEGIPVIWRPLHEAAGNTYTQWHSGAWFWWGADGAQAYKELWIYVFNYFKDAGLRNLIWVWTTQTSSFDDVDFEFYPGDGYVDIIGRDAYQDQTNSVDALNLASQFSAITQFSAHKMVTLSEFGGMPDMADQWNAGARWLYFMPWYDYDLGEAGYNSENHSSADIGWWNASFASDVVISRDELPADLFE